MKEIERIGLLKMDFLGLSTLTLINDAIAEVERTTGEKLDITRIPLDELKYWSVDLQEAYSTPAAVLQRHYPGELKP